MDFVVKLLMDQVVYYLVVFLNLLSCFFFLVIFDVDI